MSGLKLALADVEQARGVLGKMLDTTPLLPNRWLSERLGCQVFLKLENMQPIGSFKIRGATYKISRLAPQQRRRGVITASAGNHAQGVAWGCAQFKTRATIVMPVNAPLTKVQNTEALGAKVILQGDNYDEAHAVARKFAAKSGAIFVHPYEDLDVMAGQGTVGLEIIEQLPDVDVVIGSLGGGGLMAGVGTVIKEFKPRTTVVGVQASGSRSLVESLAHKKIVATGMADTFADGIKVMRASPGMLAILMPLVDLTAHADDESIAAAVLTLMEKAKVVAEGAAALPLAVLEQIKGRFKGKKVVLIISGGNIDVNVLSRIIDRGLIRAGRRVRVNVYISDRPGSLNRLTALIAEQGANILQAIHDRDTPATGISETTVELTLETRGPKYSEDLIKALRGQVARLEVLH
ncbi:MAG: threonine ammonia-lyase [Deltaproteobacteria bacterium]|nr:threonine ammonia-lyase [Deltaproteobacteria bacterium]